MSGLEQNLKIEQVGIVGFGLMGTQIAQFFAQQGIDVVAIDVTKERLEKGIEVIKSGRFGLKKLVERGRISEEEMKTILKRLRVSTDYKALKESDLVIEAVYEDVELKKEVLAKISEIARNAIIGSNTSSISITKLSSAVEKPEKFLGIHFFNPAQVQRLVELVRGLLTADEVIHSLKEFFSSLGKVPITVNDSPGFATSRLGLILGKEALLMIQEGVASPQDIDIGMILGYGHSMGPIETGDLVGLDTRLKIYQAMFEATKDPKWAPPKLLIQLVDAGYLGDPSVRPGSKGGVYEYFGQERASKVLKKLGLKK